jgi:hypothetical protein
MLIVSAVIALMVVDLAANASGNESLKPLKARLFGFETSLI